MSIFRFKSESKSNKENFNFPKLNPVLRRRIGYLTGFTLIELLVVLAVIALIASVVTVHLKGARERAKLAKTMQWSASIYHLLGAEARGIWSFNEGAYNTCSDGKDVCDISGNGNNGEIHNDGAVWVDGIPGMTGKALYFDGINDYVDVGPVGISGNESRTITGWVKCDDISQHTWTNIFGFAGGNGPNQFFDIEVDGGATCSGNGYIIHVYAHQWCIKNNWDTGWHFIAATYDGSKIKAYYDGVKVVDVLYSSLNAVDNVHMGKRNDNSNYFKGFIDEVKIYAEALPETVIKQHYLAGLKRHQNLTKK